MTEQQGLRFRTWGGARRGAGRPSSRAALPHRPREQVRPYQPVHITLKMAAHAEPRGAARRGEPMRDGWVDPFSSAGQKVTRSAQQVLFPEPVTASPATWLLSTALRQAR
jgi:hypothetical protein